MNKYRQNNLLIALIGWGAILFSAEALIYYTRWFIPLLTSGHSFVAPPVNIPELWFMLMIGSNLIFLAVGMLLLRLHRKYLKSGYFEKDSLHILDWVTILSLCLAFLGVIQTIFENFNELHTEGWVSVWSTSNGLFRFFTRLLILKAPQTMYFLFAAIMWAVRQFVVQALNVKKENEAFI